MNTTFGCVMVVVVLLFDVVVMLVVDNREDNDDDVDEDDDVNKDCGEHVGELNVDELVLVSSVNEESSPSTITFFFLL